MSLEALQVMHTVWPMCLHGQYCQSFSNHAHLSLAHMIHCPLYGYCSTLLGEESNNAHTCKDSLTLYLFQID